MMNTFGNKLTNLREEMGVSPEKLAEKLTKSLENRDNKKYDSIYSISANTIRNYEKGKYPKNFEYYEILADFFHVTPNYLFDDNIVNKSYENIEISKVLKLKDETISSIKKINQENENSFNNFIINIDKNFWNMLQELNNIQTLERLIIQIEKNNIQYFKNKVKNLMDLYLEFSDDKEIIENIKEYNSLTIKKNKRSIKKDIGIETQLVYLLDNIKEKISFKDIIKSKKLVKDYSLNNQIEIKNFLNMLLENSDLILKTLKQLFNQYSEHYYQTILYNFKESIENINIAIKKDILIDLETLLNIYELVELKSLIFNKKESLQFSISKYLTLYINK